MATGDDGHEGKIQIFIRAFTFCFNIIWLVPSIIAMINGLNYDESNSECAVSTEDDGTYTIDLDLFAIIAGAVVIGWFVLFLCGCMIPALFCWDKIVEPTECTNKVDQGMQMAFWFTLLFLFIWAIFGFIIRGEMNELCKNESIGQIVFALSLIYIITIPFMCCGGCCLFSFGTYQVIKQAAEAADQ